MGQLWCLTKKGKCYYKKGLFFCITIWGKWYYSVGQVLQSLAISVTNLRQVLQSGAAFITKWRRYYKAGQRLLQNRAGITEWGNYYKLGQYSAHLDSQPLVFSDSFTIFYLLKPTTCWTEKEFWGRFQQKKNGKTSPFKWVKQTKV